VTSKSRVATAMMQFGYLKTKKGVIRSCSHTDVVTTSTISAV